MEEEGMWALRVLRFCRVREASSRPRREFKPRPREPFELGELEQPNGGFPCAPAPKITGTKPHGRWQGRSEACSSHSHLPSSLLTASSSFRSADKPIRTPSKSMRECLGWESSLPSLGERDYVPRSHPSAACSVIPMTSTHPGHWPICSALTPLPCSQRPWTSQAARHFMTLSPRMMASWASERVTSSRLPTRLMRTGMRGCCTASQVSSHSAMCRCWCLCLSDWRLHTVARHSAAAV